MQLFSADPTIFSKTNGIFLCPQKVKKPTLKSCSENLKSPFFPYCPELPKQPKQKNSCSKIWLIDLLYRELGLRSEWNSVRKAVECWPNVGVFSILNITGSFTWIFTSYLSTRGPF